jgi:glutamate synthase (NADPH/NADH) small chain|tara:strand:- start:92 stop:1504 length:1413 start_codon:yes stop_codon:yes gene_type:complete
MLEFFNKKQSTPVKTEAEKRIKDFQEIYKAYSPDESVDQASRCSQCGIPYCQIHCPLNNNIPDWLKYIAEDRLEEAYEVSSSTNAFPEVCGRVCPQDRLCEGNCVVEKAGFGSITIGSLEKHITETAWEKGWIKPITSDQKQNQKIAIIGSGPAGLAAATYLIEYGYEVEVFEKNDRIGGLMIYGIPNFKLDKSVVLRRSDWLKESGVIFHTNCEIGKDIKFEFLEKKFDAILISTGVYKARSLDFNTDKVNNSIPALEYLIESNKIGLGDKPSPNNHLNAKNKKVLVIGGGDTAMDCVRTAVRQEASEVICLYRRNKESMPGSAREVANAEQEGVKFKWLSVPSKIVQQNSIASSLVYKVAELGAVDDSGRRSPVDTGIEKTLNSDLIIEALGFQPENINENFNINLDLTGWGTIKVDFNRFQTSNPKIFAAGDIVRGASLVVWAIYDGREVAKTIKEFLQNKKIKKAS